MSSDRQKCNRNSILYYYTYILGISAYDTYTYRLHYTLNQIYLSAYCVLCKYPQILTIERTIERPFGRHLNLVKSFCALYTRSKINNQTFADSEHETRLCEYVLHFFITRPIFYIMVLTRKLKINSLKHL